jgi:hypothetical protein
MRSRTTSCHESVVGYIRNAPTRGKLSSGLAYRHYEASWSKSLNNLFFTRKCRVKQHLCVIWCGNCVPKPQFGLSQHRVIIERPKVEHEWLAAKLLRIIKNSGEVSAAGNI